MNLYQVTCFLVRESPDFYAVRAKTPRQAAEIVRDVIREISVISVLLRVRQLVEPATSHPGYCYPMIADADFIIDPKYGKIIKNSVGD